MIVDVLKIFQLRHSNAVAQPVYRWWNLLLPSDFCTVNAYRLHTSLSWDKLIFCTVSPKCQGVDVILFWLNCIDNYEDKWKGQEWAPPPPAVLLIRSIKFLCLINYQDWDSNFDVPSSSKWYLPWRYMVCNFFTIIS